ncbi:MFS transporter [Rhizorhabdus wittichii]|uniref:MFS transporter n=1 Tax=Rhizorhabdus wittichii TaxID=160791 RepID=A0A975D1K7_9SPHN|nr:MFS transporter [Rhizorhabdus wittichii]QTH21174.1 MFS transporter [Rhizorhabdus wittichii]
MTGEGGAEQAEVGEAGSGGWLTRERLVPIVVASALFMDLMDSSALAMALPTIARHFGVSIVELKLALTAYVVTVAVLVPTSGWLAGRFGARRVFLIAMALFVGGSMCCGLAGSVPQLVAARVLQGFGGAMMTPVGRIILVASVRREDLVRGMAWYTLPAIVAPVVGPPLVGLLIEFANWRWIFFINVPVGVIGMVAVFRFVAPLTTTRRPGFDFPGFLLAGATILAAMAMVETGALAGQAWPLRIAGLAGVGLIAAVYLRQAMRAPEPIADFRVLRHATLRWSLISTWLHRVALGGLMLLLPLQLQLGLGYSPLEASQVMIAAALGSMASRFISPIGIRRLGFRRLMLLCSGVTVVLTLVPATFSASTPIIVMCAVMIAHAAIRASYFLAGNTLSYSDVEGDEIGHASVLFAIFQQISLGMGFNLATHVLEAGGGPHDPTAFIWSYGAIALLTFAGTMAIRPLPPHVGENMRHRAST